MLGFATTNYTTLFMDPDSLHFPWIVCEGWQSGHAPSAVVNSSETCNQDLLTPTDGTKDH